MKRSGRGIGFIVIGILLVVGALALSFYNIYEDYLGNKQSKSMLDAILASLPEVQEALDPEDMASREVVDETTIPDYILHPEMELPIGEYDGVKCVGIIEIPKLSIKLPVIGEWSYANFKIAPCRYAGTPYLNNFVIAAHNYRSHFGQIRTLTQGDEVDFTDMNGNIFRYAVDIVDTLNPTDVDKMTNGKWDMTLFTCTVGGRTRVTVRCDRMVRRMRENRISLQ